MEVQHSSITACLSAASFNPPSLRLYLSPPEKIASMDVLSAATETVANADAIAAAAATLSVAAASSVASSPRASSPTNSTSTRDGAGGGGAVSRPDGSEMDEEDTPSMRSRESSSAMATVVPVAATVPVAGISPAIREAHAKLEAQAEDIRNGEIA